MNALVTIGQTNAEVYRASTDAADLCREIVKSTAMVIQKRRYVKVEGWQAIAIAHGCTGSACAVERIDGGVRATGQIRRMSDGALIAEAEGFVGEDEPVWFGGTAMAWEWGKEKGQKIWKEKLYEKRPDYAIRAMAQTRAISRACRSAFAHVVVMIDAGLSTTPAEEVPAGGFDDEPHEPRNVTPELKPDAPSKKAAGPTLSERADKAIRSLQDAASIEELDRISNTPEAHDLIANLDNEGMSARADAIVEVAKQIRATMGARRSAPVRETADVVFA